MIAIAYTVYMLLLLFIFTGIIMVAIIYFNNVGTLNLTFFYNIIKANE